MGGAKFRIVAGVTEPTPQTGVDLSRVNYCVIWVYCHKNVRLSNGETDDLHELNLTVISNEECSRSDLVHRNAVHPGTLCAGIVDRATPTRPTAMRDLRLILVASVSGSNRG